MEPLQIVRVFTGEDNRSHLARVALPFDRSGPLAATRALASQGVRFVELPDGYDSPLHNAPARQIVVFLEGECELTTGAGARWRGARGDLLLAEDVSGEGHAFRVLKGPLRALFVPLPADADLLGASAS